LFNACPPTGGGLGLKTFQWNKSISLINSRSIFATSDGLVLHVEQTHGIPAELLG